MKPPVKLTVFAVIILFQSCIFNEPVDERQLDTNYFYVFHESLDQVVFDNLAISSNGYFYDSEANRYLYRSDLLDTLTHRHMVLIHNWEDQKILSSHIDATYNTTESYNENYKIVWKIDSRGVIQGAQRYDSNGRLIVKENYVFDVNPAVYNSANLPGWVSKIKEKTKYDRKGLLLQKIIYTYNEDGSFETQVITPATRE